jgi:hypothetical protein
MNSSSVCLLGCEATGNRFSEALFRIYDGGVTVSGCALSENEFGSCYTSGSCYAVTGSGQDLVSFSDFVHMERKPFEGEYVGPAPYVTPGDIGADPYVTPGDISYEAPPAAPAWDGERTEVHVKTVDELLAAVAPHTTIYLDGEVFDLSTASDFGGAGGDYYAWSETFDGPELIFVNHGDPDAADSFTACLNTELGYHAFAPYSGTRFDLLRGDFEYIAEAKPVEAKREPSSKAARLFGELISAAERLLRACRRMEGHPNKELVRFTKEIEKLSDSMEK